MTDMTTNIKQFTLDSFPKPSTKSNMPNIPVIKIKQGQEIWESDQLWEMFFTHSLEGIWFMEAVEPFLWDDTIDKEKALDYAFEHQHIVWVNNAMLQQYGATLEQFIGLTLNDFFAHNIEKARNMWRQVFDNKKLTCETMEHKFRGSEKFAGDTVWFMGDYFCIYNSEGRMVGHFGAQRDITDRKLAEQALKESQERYRFIAKHVADGIMIIQGNRLQFVNHAFTTMFDYPDQQQLMGRDIFELISHESIDQFESFIRQLQTLYNRMMESGGRGKVFQGLFLSRKGREFWAESQFALIKWHGKSALLCTIRDINERKLQEITAQEHADALYQENIKLRSSIKDRYRFCNIMGKSPGMQKVYELIIRAASSDANVVIYGESGTGKELVTHAIHDLSDRAKKALVPVNCHAIPDSLMESEFFGHRKGAFTGAHFDKQGLLEMANEGDLFLDEVGDLSLSMQGKLLRAIEGGGYTPVGSSEVCYSNFRIIAATNKNIGKAVRNGTMREDFYYRIHIVPITLPPLRERKEDIPLLIDHFLTSFEQNQSSQIIPGKVLEALYNYDWPGNVRELQNALHQYITVGHLDFLGSHPSQTQPHEMTQKTANRSVQPDMKFRLSVDAFEKDLIIKTLNQTNWNRIKATQLLDIPRRTLYNKMKKYGLI